MTTWNQQGAAGNARFVAFLGRGKAILLGLLLFGLVFWTFLPAIHNGFVSYDDARYVTANSRVQRGLAWESVLWAFRTTAVSNWHPLTWLSHMLDCQLFGLKPWGHHLTSVLLHAVNSVLVFLVLRRLTAALWRSLFVAALFGLHPLRVESVAWVAERKDVLSTLFFLLTLMMYARYVELSKGQRPKSKVRYALALMFFALGLMCKPMLVTLPLVLLLLDFWPLNRLSGGQTPIAPIPSQNSILNTHNSEPPTLWRLVGEKAPFFLLSAASCVVTFNAQKGAMIWMANVPFLDRLGNALISCWRYLGKLFWPAQLSCLYPVIDWPAATVLLAGFLLLAASALATVLWRRAPYLFTSWFWFVGTLAPVIGLVAVGEQSIADRYTYIPCIGVLVALAWGADDLTKGWRWQAAAFGAGTAGAVLACILITRQNLGHWKDTESLFRQAIQSTEKNYRAYVNLGAALFYQGRVEEALRCFEEAVKSRPDSAEAHLDLGVAWHARNRSAEAISQYQEALRLKPDYAGAHFNLGVVLEEAGQLEQAIQAYQQAAGLERQAAFYRHLGAALARRGRADEAMAAFQQAIRLDPRDASAYLGLGGALQQKGRVEEAAAQFRQALTLNPEDTLARSNLDLMLNGSSR